MSDDDKSTVQVKLLPVRLSSLFASPLVVENDPFIYRVFSPELERVVLKGVQQIFLQTKRRSDRLAIEDDEFFHIEKSRRLEQARRIFRTGTRFNQSIPERKMPLSTLLSPPIGSSNHEDWKKIGWEIIHELPPSHPTGNQTEKIPEFPGSIPVSLMRADIPNLFNPKYFYVFAPKTNGLRFFQVCCTFFGEKIMCLVDRSQTVYMVSMPVPEIFFDGTIFDGELVPLSSGQFCYLIYDAMQTNGVACSEHNYLIRLYLAGFMIECWSKSFEVVESSEQKNDKKESTPVLFDKKESAPVLFDKKESTSKTTIPDTIADITRHLLNDKSIEPMEADENWTDLKQEVWDPKKMPFCVRVKQVYSMEQILKLLEVSIPALDHEIDGLIITAVESPVQMGRTDTIYKYKRGADNTIDLAFHYKPTPEQKGNEISTSKTAYLMCPKGTYNVWSVWTKIDIFFDETPAYVATRLGLQLNNDNDIKQKIINELEGRVLECRYRHSHDDWYVESIRWDKTMPNKLSTAEKTLINIKENLSLMDIFVVGSVNEETRQRIAKWEELRKNKHWQDKPLPTSFHGHVIGMGPMSLQHISKFS